MIKGDKVKYVGDDKDLERLDEDVAKRVSNKEGQVFDIRDDVAIVWYGTKRVDDVDAYDALDSHMIVVPIDEFNQNFIAPGDSGLKNIGSF